MLDKTKTDPILGRKVNAYLKEKGVQTPFSSYYEFDTEKKIVEVAGLFEEIIKILGLDLEDDSIQETPMRVGKMFVNELYWGLDFDNFPKITTVENKMKYNEMVIERNIKIFSNCEHHFITIDGICNIGYIPRNKVLGLSKLNRIVEYFARRPQIQERLGEQIYYALEYILETPDIAVTITANHYCVKSRGVGDVNSSTSTSKMGGIFLSNSNAKQEFLQFINEKVYIN